eukprot:1337747-Amorphochlora_amoeboformis.AAC.1
MHYTQVLPNDHPFTIAASYTKYNLAVTKRKETEDRVSSVYGHLNPLISLTISLSSLPPSRLSSLPPSRLSSLTH